MIRARFGTPVVDAAAIREYVSSPGGPVARDLMRRGGNVQTRARQLVRKRTRALERSIVKRLTIESGGPVVWVGSDVEYALLEHEGTPAHTIRPRSKRVLRFVAAGRVVYAREVRHPGTKGSYFLVKALPAGRS